MSKHVDQLSDEVASVLTKKLHVFQQTIDVGILRLHEYTNFLINNIYISKIFGSLRLLKEPPLLIIEVLDKMSFKNKIDLLFSQKIISQEFHSRLVKLNSDRISNAHVKKVIGRKTINPEVEVEYFLVNTLRAIFGNIKREIKDAEVFDELEKLSSGTKEFINQLGLKI